jgi:hypothetical protein
MKKIFSSNWLVCAAAAACMFLLLIISGCVNTADSGADAEITGFVFSVKENQDYLSQDIAGSVDTGSRLITVKLPASVYADTTVRAALRASIAYGTGTVYAGAASNPDYSVSPVALPVTTQSGNSATYLVKIERQYDTASQGSLLFTEYYSGLAYAFKGTNNQYVEITNMSAAPVELGGCELNRHCWQNGIRYPAQDQSVQLSGTLASGESLVIYSARTTFSFSGKCLSDAYLNSVVSFSGEDGLTLTSGGIVLDALGPGDGIGTGWNWGAAKRMQRKNSVTAYSGWKESEWITSLAANTASDASNAGFRTPALSASAKEITYFAFENLDDVVYGTIDTADKTVTVNVKEQYGTVLEPTVSTNGSDIRLADMSRIISGKTSIDFSSAAESNPLKLYVYDNNGTPCIYGVIFNVIKETVYTRTNYDFDGGIQSVLEAIKNGDTSFNTDVTGILTCKNVYGYKTAQACFFLQDKNAGLYFYISDTADTPLPVNAIAGNKVTAHVTAGQIYYAMPEVTKISAAEVTDSSVHDIYYETDRYSEEACTGRIYEYAGTIEKGMDSYAVGTFSETEGLYFHADFDFQEKLAKGTYGRFYGPVLYSYSQYRMEITDENQIKSD